MSEWTPQDERLALRKIRDLARPGKTLILGGRAAIDILSEIFDTADAVLKEIDKGWEDTPEGTAETP